MHLAQKIASILVKTWPTFTIINIEEYPKYFRPSDSEGCGQPSFCKNDYTGVCLAKHNNIIISTLTFCLIL